jgi:hypothetical protein
MVLQRHDARRPENVTLLQNRTARGALASMIATVLVSPTDFAAQVEINKREDYDA